MRIVVIGAGAIGGLVGGKLAASGQDVVFVDRAPFVETVRAKGLRLSEAGQDEVTLHPQAVTSLAEAFQTPADLALLCVKGFNTQEAVDGLRPYADRFSFILSLQNGISNDEILSQAFGPHRVLAGTITHPVGVPELGAVRSEKKRGGIGLASLVTRDVMPWVELFKSAGFVTYDYADYRRMKWSKLLLNIIGNASSAVLNMNTVQVFANPQLVALEVTQLREALRVMRKLKLRTVPLPGYPVPLLALAVQFLPTFLLTYLLRPLVAGGRAEKLPSLLIELNRNSGQSEVDDLNGAVARAGQEVGVPTPVNATLAATVNLLTIMPSQRGAWHHNADRLILVARGAQKKKA